MIVYKNGNATALVNPHIIFGTASSATTAASVPFTVNFATGSSYTCSVTDISGALATGERWSFFNPTPSSISLVSGNAGFLVGYICVGN